MTSVTPIIQHGNSFVEVNETNKCRNADTTDSNNGEGANTPIDRVIVAEKEVGFPLSETVIDKVWLATNLAIKDGIGGSVLLGELRQLCKPAIPLILCSRLHRAICQVKGRQKKKDFVDSLLMMVGKGWVKGRATVTELFR